MQRYYYDRFGNFRGWSNGDEVLDNYYTYVAPPFSLAFPKPENEGLFNPVVGQQTARFVGNGEEVWRRGIVENVEIDSPAQPAGWFTYYQFLQRFTLDEKAGVLEAAKTNSYLAAFLLDLQAAGGCYLTDSQTIAGVQALVAAGLLSEERGSVILTA